MFGAFYVIIYSTCKYCLTLIGYRFLFVAVVSKSEISKVTKLYHRLKTDESGVVPLSSATELSHFRNNALVKLVAKQYTRKQDGMEQDHRNEESIRSREEVLDLEQFVKLFDILSPKKDISIKVKGNYCN